MPEFTVTRTGSGRWSFTVTHEGWNNIYRRRASWETKKEAEDMARNCRTVFRTEKKCIEEMEKPRHHIMTQNDRFIGKFESIVKGAVLKEELQF